jgi:uncharacterized protein YciI
LKNSRCIVLLHCPFAAVAHEWQLVRKFAGKSLTAIDRLPCPFTTGAVVFFKEEFVMHYLLIYDLVPDYLERRGEYRDAHLKLAWEAAGRGELMLGGALTEPVDTAMLLFNGDTPRVAEAFAQVDPYVRAGLVTRWRVREWKTVAGEGAANPVR